MSIHPCVLLSEGGCQMSGLWLVRWDRAGLGLGSRIANPPMSGVLDLMSAHERLSLEGSPELRSHGDMPRSQTTTSRGP